MNLLDWSIVCLYLAGMILFSVYLSRGQKEQADYYVGGRALPWWAVGLSTMATQTSAISFISVPAFVALREGGGLTWLQYEFAVPLAIIFVMICLIPFFRRLRLISVYEYLEMRYGPGTRSLLAGVFLLSRGLATGVAVYASAIVLAVCMGTDLWLMILLIGVVTLIYDAIGGMKAVVYNFCESRAGEHARAFLGEWRGSLVCDDFAGYKASFTQGVTEAGCLAHARRKFFDLHAANKSQIAEHAIRQLAQVYEIEQQVKAAHPGANEVTIRKLVKQQVDALEQKGLLIKQWDLDFVGADLTWCGRSGSPTKVHRIQSVVLAAKESKDIQPTDEGITDMIHELIQDKIIA